jgi:hypothetical protein
MSEEGGRHWCVVKAGDAQRGATRAGRLRREVQVDQGAAAGQRGQQAVDKAQRVMGKEVVRGGEGELRATASSDEKSFGNLSFINSYFIINI